VFRPGIRDGCACVADPTDFQLKYAPRAWKQERLVWTTVVQLNLIKNVNGILDILGHEIAAQATRIDTNDRDFPAKDLFSEKHKILKLRLAPLRGVQADLERKLGSGVFEDHGHSNNHGQGPAQFASVISRTESSYIDDDDLHNRRLPKEFCVRSNNSWKDRFKNGLRNAGRPYTGESSQNVITVRGGNEKGDSSGKGGKVTVDLEGITGIIAECREDIKALWEDELVQRTLSKRRYRVDESSGLCVLRLPNRSVAEG